MEMQVLSFCVAPNPPRASAVLVRLYRATPRLVVFHRFKRVVSRKLILNPKEVPHDEVRDCRASRASVRVRPWLDGYNAGCGARSVLGDIELGAQRYSACSARQSVGGLWCGF